MQPPSQFTYDYEPDSLGLIASVSGPIHTVSNTWETDRDVLDLKQNKVGETVVSSYDYTVNALGQRTDVSQTGTAFAAARGIVWGYDALGQVVKADHDADNTHDRAYQYDAIGNRLEARDGVTTVTGTSNYTANALNQYTIAAGVTLPTTPDPAPYDLDGNLRFDGGVNKDNEAREYVWDAENRLIAVKRVSDSVTLATYLYDAQSRRIAKTAGGTTTLFIYDGWNCIAEYSYSPLPAPSSTLTKSYTWGLDLSGSFQGAGGVGGLLAISSPITTNPITFNSYFPTFDGNGNVSEYLDASGTLTAHFEYDPFGNTVVNSDVAGLFPYRFSTKQQDAETGLYYYGYRYYDPLTGRWPSRDPIEEEGGLNLYAFVVNDGVNRWDILGLEGDEPGKPYKKCKLLQATPLAHGGVRRKWTTTSWGGLVVTEHVERYITLRECKFRCYHENTNSCPRVPCRGRNCRLDHGVEVVPRTKSTDPNRSCASCASIAEEVRKKSIVSGQTVVR